MSSKQQLVRWSSDWVLRYLSWFVAAVLLSSTLFFAWLLRRAEERRLESTFIVNTTNVSVGLKDQLAFQEQSVVALAAWFQANEDASRAEFREFSEMMLSKLANVQAFEWVPLVKQSDRAGFEQAARDDGFDNFLFKQWQSDGTWLASSQPWADEYYPVFFVHPTHGNEAAFGIDLASNEDRFIAISKSRSSQVPIATGRIELAQESGEQAGFLVMVPLDDSGFAVGVFRLGDLIGSVLSARNIKGLRLQIVDESAQEDRNRKLYQSPGFPSEIIDARWQATFRHTIGGRNWALHWRYHPDYLANELSNTPLVILVCGTLLSGLLFFTLNRNYRSRVKKQSLLEKLQSTQKGLLLHQRAIDSASDAVFFIRKDSSFVYVNRRASEFLGYTRDELLRLSVVEINPTQDKSSWQQLWNKLLKDETVIFESKHQRKDGSIYECEIRVGLVMFDGEQIMVATVIDITERRLIQRERQLAQRTVDLSADAIFFIREDGSFQYANEQAANYLGYTREELCQMTVSDINPSYPMEKWPSHWEETKREGLLVLESQHQRKDGSIYDCELRKIFLKFEGESIIVGLVRDITETKRARRALEESENRFNWATTNANVGVWDWNVVTNEALFSATAKTQLGYSANSDWESFSEWASRLHPEDRETTLQRVSQLAENPHENYNSEFRLKTINGDYIWIRAVGRGVFDDAGELVRYVGVHIDITELKNTTTELKQSIAELEQFAYIASHDLRAPLRAIEQLSNWLVEDIADDLPEVSKGHLDLISQRAARMKKLLDDLLVYAKAGRTKETASEFDLVGLVNDLCELGTVPVDFQLEIDFEVKRMIGRPTPLETVLRNLIANAVKHHDVGQGIIRIKNQKADSFVNFTVSDDGPGIDPVYHERVMGMFQTLRPRDDVEGSGLGLALVKKLVEAEGGSISLDAAVPRGLMVKFTWPIQN